MAFEPTSPSPLAEEFKEDSQQIVNPPEPPTSPIRNPTLDDPNASSFQFTVLKDLEIGGTRVILTKTHTL